MKDDDELAARIAEAAGRLLLELRKTTDDPAVHVPVWQVSCVQRLPSRLQDVPLPFATGAGQPVAATHDPMVWH